MQDDIGKTGILPSQSHAVEQDQLACRADIVSLINAMHSQLKDELGDYKFLGSIPGFESFADVAMAFNLPSVYKSLWRTA